MLSALLALLALPAAAQAPLALPLPGRLIDAAGVTGPGGRPGVALLLAAGRDGKGAKTLLFLDPERRSLQPLAERLHEEVNAVIGFDLDGNGAADPPRRHAGRAVRAPGGRKVLDESGGSTCAPSPGTRPGRPWLAFAHAGLLEL